MERGSRFSSITTRRKSRALETARGRRNFFSGKNEFLIALGVWALIGVLFAVTWTSFSGGSSDTVIHPPYHPGEEIYLKAMADAKDPPKPPVKPRNAMRIPVFQAPAFHFDFKLPPLEQFVPDKPAAKSSASSTAAPARDGVAPPGQPNE